MPVTVRQAGTGTQAALVRWRGLSKFFETICLLLLKCTFSSGTQASTQDSSKQLAPLRCDCVCFPGFGSCPRRCALSRDSLGAMIFRCLRSWPCPLQLWTCGSTSLFSRDTDFQNFLDRVSSQVCVFASARSLRTTPVLFLIVPVLAYPSTIATWSFSCRSPQRTSCR